MKYTLVIVGISLLGFGFFQYQKSEIIKKEVAVTEKQSKQFSYQQIENNSIYPFISNYDSNQALIHYIKIPKGYQLVDVEDAYANWLLHLPVKKNNTVYLYNGEKKHNQTVQYKVIDIDVGNKDLQQCADAVMRLRAEYLYATKQYNKIHFNYTNGVKIGFDKWSSGLYPALKGNKVNWVPSSKNNTSHASFRKYMNNIFMYAGTASLSKELKSVQLSNIKAGDVFILGGFPGHAITVLAVALNPTTKDKCFMLAQSYMPAQNIHVLKNLNQGNLSPWFSLKGCSSVIKTPEWTFYPNQLKRFEE